MRWDSLLNNVSVIGYDIKLSMIVSRNSYNFAVKNLCSEKYDLYKEFHYKIMVQIKKRKSTRIDLQQISTVFFYLHT